MTTQTTGTTPEEVLLKYLDRISDLQADLAEARALLAIAVPRPSIRDLGARDWYDRRRAFLAAHPEKP